jgi:hypothetical protein
MRVRPLAGAGEVGFRAGDEIGIEGELDAGHGQPFSPFAAWRLV